MDFGQFSIAVFFCTHHKWYKKKIKCDFIWGFPGSEKDFDLWRESSGVKIGFF